jgi:hypothetical protein
MFCGFCSILEKEMKKEECSIDNGLLGMKRDINLKLVKFLEDNEIIQVFLLI